nr:CD8 beta chain [Homo sapiens]
MRPRLWLLLAAQLTGRRRRARLRFMKQFYK